ncbi:K(+)-stimulated pyrophosphate-energized sodium pump [Spirochaetia bacterium]|nr:K(+)-stimulated pyrophosphate-energized sodium pump [Spirochaetia bacterium]
MLSTMIYLVGLGVILTLIFAYYNFQKGAKMEHGTPTMQEIAKSIREGANAFLKREFSIDIPVIIVIAVLFGVFFSPWTGFALILGSTMSSFAGLVGMRAAVIYNERVTNEARLGVERKDASALGKALNVAFRGGSVMGLSVGGFAMLGLLVVYLVVGSLFHYANPENLVETTSWVGLKFTIFPQVLACYSLGCSAVAVFNRLGGGIYTKGADMGADLVGKTELGLPEDDPRNPAVIADCVGDNVGDVNGNGSDLLESTIGATVATAILPTALYTAALNSAAPLSKETISLMMEYPVAFMGVGLLACVLGVLYVLLRKPSNKLSRELNISLWSSAGIIAVATLALSYYFFNGQDLSGTGFRFGWISPWLSSIFGILAGIALGLLAERYTSEKYKETLKIADLAKEGPALVIVSGTSSGWRSCMPACATLGFAIIASSYFSGLYGSAIAAVGMLSFVVATVTVDTYGPISDNAGGIAEMAQLDAEVRNITDSLDSQGNTTAAIGKGFAIGSGVLAALAMMMSFAQGGDSGGVLNIINYIALGGAFIGVGLMHWLSGQMLNAVCNNAKEMVDEVRRQVTENPKILTGEAKPDSNRCIDICTKSAIGEMRKPVLIALLAPIVGGFVFGPLFVGGLLLGAILDSVVMATSTANSGGAWDNAKKYIKSIKSSLVAEYGEARYNDIHNASVIGDTVGDGYKDVVGPNQDIMIKMMSTVSVIMLPVMSAFNLISLVL